MTLRVLVVKVLKGLKLNKIASSIYYRYFHGFASAGRELPDVVRRCFQRTIDSGVARQGDYYEFGVFKGHTFWQAQRIAHQLGLDQMRYFGFDSFEGLPEPKGLDKTDEEHFYKGQYACSLETVRRTLTEHGMDWDTAYLIKGYFNQTLNEQTCREYDMGKITVALVDCDLYESTVDTLRFIDDMIVEGSILIMDDWNAFNSDENRGQRRAMREFLDTHPQWSTEEWFSYGSYGRVFVMHTAAGPVGAVHHAEAR